MFLIAGLLALPILISLAGAAQPQPPRRNGEVVVLYAQGVPGLAAQPPAKGRAGKARRSYNFSRGDGGSPEISPKTSALFAHQIYIIVTDILM